MSKKAPYLGEQPLVLRKFCLWSSLGLGTVREQRTSEIFHMCKHAWRRNSLKPNTEKERERNPETFELVTHAAGMVGSSDQQEDVPLAEMWKRNIIQLLLLSTWICSLQQNQQGGMWIYPSSYEPFPYSWLSQAHLPSDLLIESSSVSFLSGFDFPWFHVTLMSGADTHEKFRGRKSAT